MQEHLKAWSPIAIHELVTLFADVPFPWWVAGGHAIELALGRTLRSHADIDVLILRKDHEQLRSFLSGWDCWVADPPGRLRVWPEGETLGLELHDVWCRTSSAADWGFQVMIDESQEKDWISRRDSSVRDRLSNITMLTESGIPYLAAHVQLYYKAKNSRPKDEIDFEAAIAGSAVAEMEWLRLAITKSYGADHPWLEMMAN